MIKVYTSDNSLRLVGKSWQIRAKLKELSRSSLTVQQFIQISKAKTIKNERKNIKLV